MTTLKGFISRENLELRVRSEEFLRSHSSSSLKTLNSFIDYCMKEGILTKKKTSVNYPAIIKSPEPSLRYLELQITNRCNLRCRHCYINNTQVPSHISFMEKRGNNELSVNQIRTILKEFEEMQGLRVMITGGEPLLHTEFSEINEMLPGFLIRKVLFTNGLLLNKNNLKKLNVDEIQISIDGLEEAHNSLRGEGTFKPAIEAVKLSLDYGFDVSISTMLHSKNLDDLDEMERLSRGMGVKDWTVDVPCIAGRLKGNIEFQLSPEQGGRYLRYGFGDGLHGGESGFACGLHLMAVIADGRVSKCSFYSDSAVGRIEDGLGECWQRIKPVRLEELKCDCEYIESCRGGCRYRAGLLGDPLGKDLYRCASYGIISKS